MLILNNLITEDTFNLEKYLHEGKISVVKRGVGSKRNALAGATAMQIAKQRNPAMFRLYMKHNLIRKQLKAKINKQFGAIARAQARKKLK